MTAVAAAALDVSGGAGGTAADLEAMRVAAQELARCARSVSDLAARLAALAADAAALASAPLDPAGWSGAQQRLVDATAGLGRLAVESVALATAVHAAAVAYDAADRAVAAAVAEARGRAAGAFGQLLWRLTWRYPLVVLPPVLVGTQAVLLWRTGDLAIEALTDAAGDLGSGTFRLGSVDERTRLLGVQVAVRLSQDGQHALDSSLRWLAVHPGTAEHGVAAAPSLLSGVLGLRAGAASRWGPPRVRDGRWRYPPEDVDDVAALTGVLGRRAGLIGAGSVSVRPAVTPAPALGGPPDGVEDLLARTASLRPAVAEPGSPAGSRIRIERVRTAGRSASIVYVPGTQSSSLGHGANPMDVASNIDAMAGMRSASQDAVVAALRAADVRRDEPLLLVGYSQGGLTSLGLVRDPEFTEEFSPVAVVTAGAPTAGLPPPDDVAVLSLEHAEDLVTVLDGAQNPDTPSWTTVRRDVLAAAEGDRQVRAAFDERPLAPHDVQGYVRTAALVDDSEHDSVQEWRERVAPFLDRPGATAVATEWVATRAPS